MNTPSSSAFAAVAMLVVALAFTPQRGWAQALDQVEYERQQREYRLQQERQREQQQQLQQLMNENARRQQEESSRINAPAGQPSGGLVPGTTQAAPGAAPGARGADPAGAQAASAARAMWEKRPALPPDRNPLLGKWIRPPSTRPNPSDPFGAVMAMAKGGLCEVLFGGGVFEFRPDRLVGMDERTPPKELDRVEYRGDARHVVVLPKTTLKLIEFDVEGPDRINWASQKCVLVRVGAASRSASAAAPATAGAAAAGASARSGATAGGVLAFSVGAPSPDNKVAGRKVLVLTEDPQMALIKGGLKSSPYGSVLQNWLRACAQRTPDCEKGGQALRPRIVEIATTDADGRARTQSLPSGRYWVLSDAMVGNKRMMWHELVDMRSGDHSLTLDHRNAKPVD